MTASLLILALAAAWALHYARSAVRAPLLSYGQSALNAHVLAQLPRLRQPYRPTPWLYNAHLQLLWLVGQTLFARALRYDRTDRLTMRDGGTTALAWLGLDTPPRTPTLVVLHTITGDPQSMRALVRDLREATGFRIVVCTRRGHGDLPLTAPAINTMGCTDDLREQLEHIRAQFPGSPLHAVGVSAGSGLLVRYLGEEGARSLIRVGVAYCPGYDIRVAFRRTRPFYSRAITKELKRALFLPHGHSLGQLRTYEACLAAKDLAELHEQLYELAGCRSADDYFARSNPVAVLEQVAVPLLIVNADDDPVCVADNARDHLEAVKRIPDALLVQTARGSHCAFFEGWTARSWAHRLVAEYLLAVGSQLTEEAHPAQHPSRRPLERAQLAGRRS